MGRHENIPRMKPMPFFVLLLLAVACAALTVALILGFRSNERLQREVQARQQALNSGILGAQGQQVSGNVLQDLAAAGKTHAAVRRLLEKHGYATPSPAPKTAPTDTVSAAPLPVAGEKP